MGSLREKIAGEVTLSENPGRTIRKWREQLKIPQGELAQELGITPSVISDYEAGRRKSPGIRTVRRIVDAFLVLDLKSGRQFSKRFQTPAEETIPSMGEFPVPMSPKEFLKLIHGKNLTPKVNSGRTIQGYTVLDSLKAILTLNAQDYMKVYGWSTERALVFTGVEYGRSPMVAVRAQTMKPAMVVYSQPNRVDPLAIQLAEIEKVILATTELPQAELIKRLEACLP